MTDPEQESADDWPPISTSIYTQCEMEYGRSQPNCPRCGDGDG